MRNALVVIAVLVLSSAAHAQNGQQHGDGQHHMMAALPLPDNAAIVITINPESRVSATLSGVLPRPAPCGKALELPVKIINQGFVTAPLEAQLVGDVPAGVTLDFHPQPLKGVPQERRVLRLTLTAPGQTDLTVAFRARHEIPDLGGRDRVHFLVQCRAEG